MSFIYWIDNQSMQNKKDWPTFNIRKVIKKNNKQNDDFFNFSPEVDTDKYTDIFTYTNPKKEKEILIDYSVNEAILNSKAYLDLKHLYHHHKHQNTQRKTDHEKEVELLREERREVLEEEERLMNEKHKFEELLNNLRQRIHQARQKNRMARQLIQSRMNTQADYLSNLLISLRFQAEYEHDIDPDSMTYEQLLELQEKIGSVSRGLTQQAMENLPTTKLFQNIEEQCTICMSGMEKEEIIIVLKGCGHKFHRECVMSWLSKEKFCSLCKRQIQVPTK